MSRTPSPPPLIARAFIHALRPAYHIPLRDEELKLVGEICAIQGQIEWIMLSSVSHLLGLREAAVDAIMYSASLDAKAKIWLEVIKSKRVDPDICEVAASAYSKLGSFTQGRMILCTFSMRKRL